MAQGCAPARRPEGDYSDSGVPGTRGPRSPPPAQAGSIWKTQLIFPTGPFSTASHTLSSYSFEFGGDDRLALLFMLLIIFSVSRLNFLKLQL